MLWYFTSLTSETCAEIGVASFKWIWLLNYKGKNYCTGGLLIPWRTFEDNPYSALGTLIRNCQKLRKTYSSWAREPNNHIDHRCPTATLLSEISFREFPSVDSIVKTAKLTSSHNESYPELRTVLKTEECRWCSWLFLAGRFWDCVRESPIWKLQPKFCASIFDSTLVLRTPHLYSTVACHSAVLTRLCRRSSNHWQKPQRGCWLVWNPLSKQRTNTLFLSSSLRRLFSVIPPK